MRGTTHFETTLDFDDEQDVDVIIHISLEFNTSTREVYDWQIRSIDRPDGSSLVLTSDLSSAVENYVNDHLGEAIDDIEGDYADYRYEQYRDQLMMEKWDG